MPQTGTKTLVGDVAKLGSAKTVTQNVRKITMHPRDHTQKYHYITSFIVQK